ncbi:MAG: hypothetical protein MUE85_15360 [Microscillaceae bacterium]|jgi:hypothetical protein|nr:hypothetical protein [Microscillaceae bacterium]
MKYLLSVFFFSLFLSLDLGFAQIKPGTYYTAYGLLSRIVEVKIEQESDKSLKFTFEGIDYTLKALNNTQYQDKENTAQLRLREDADIELLTINKDNLISGVYLLTTKKEEAKERWKKVKGALTPKIAKEAEDLIDKLSGYFYLDTDGDLGKIRLGEDYQGGDEVNINLSKYGSGNTYKKIAENTYIYTRTSGGTDLEVAFARFYPTEKKIIAYRFFRQPWQENYRLHIAQLGSAPAKNEADDKKAKELMNYIDSYVSKHRVAFLSGFKANVVADLPATKINSLIKTYFEDDYTVLQVKLVSKTWNLERNEFGRVLRRLHTVLVYLKNKSTGKCHIAFRYLGQEFDGSNYGETEVYTASSNGYDLTTDQKEVLAIYLLTSTYEVPCAELSK